MLVYLFVMYINGNNQKLIFVNKMLRIRRFRICLRMMNKALACKILSVKFLQGFHLTLTVTLEQFKTKLEKIILIQKPSGKVSKDCLLFWSLGGSMMPWIKGIS